MAYRAVNWEKTLFLEVPRADAESALATERQRRFIEVHPPQKGRLRAWEQPEPVVERVQAQVPAQITTTPSTSNAEPQPQSSAQPARHLPTPNTSFKQGATLEGFRPELKKPVYDPWQTTPVSAPVINPNYKTPVVKPGAKVKL